MKKTSSPLPSPPVVVVPPKDGVFGIHKIIEIRISPDNRKRFDEPALLELAASIKAMGVAQPILIRPVKPTEDQPEIYEIVAGERRYRASKLAGLDAIPAMVRVLSDLDAAKIRILENLQRENPHEMEEAEGYEQLMLKHGYTAPQLADEIKKSKAYVYARLKLCALTSLVRQNFLENKISASTALLIARIAVPNLQLQAYKEIIREGTSWGPMSHREAVGHIQARYMLDLTQAPFQLGDAKLLAAAGSCVKCPKRTGNQPEVFADMSADVCTDPDCFAEKRSALAARTIVEANKKGIPVFEDEEEGEDFLAAGDFTDANDWVGDVGQPFESKNYYVRVGAVLDVKQLPEAKAYIKNGTKLVPVYETGAVRAALEKAGLCETQADHAARMEKQAQQAGSNLQADSAEKQAAKHAKRVKIAADEQAFRVALYKKLRTKGATGFTVQSLREMTKMLSDQFALPVRFLKDVYDFDTSSDETLIAHIDQAGLPELQLLLVDLIVGDVLGFSTHQLNADSSIDEDAGFASVRAMAAAEGIDPDLVRIDLKMASITFADLADDELADFIRVHPGRLEELKDYILANRPWCVTTLEAAALVNGFKFWQNKFVPADAAADETAAAVEPIPPAPGADEADADAEQLADQVAAEPIKRPANNRPKVTTKVKPAAEWPWPTSADLNARANNPAPAAEPEGDDTTPIEASQAA